MENQTKNPESVLDSPTPERRNSHFLVSVHNVRMIEGFNLRQDYGTEEENRLLIQSINETGVNVPLLGYRDKENTNIWNVIDGHRRYIACKKLVDTGQVEEIMIPIRAEHKGTSEADRIRAMLTQGISQKNLNQVEQAEGIMRLVRHRWTEARICEAVGISGTQLSNLKILNTANEVLKHKVVKGEISATAVIKMIRANNGDMDKVEEIVSKAEEQTTCDGETIKPIRPKELRKAAGKTNSWQELKKVMKTVKEKKVKEKYAPIISLLQQIINEEMTREQFEQMFFEKE